MYKLRRGTHEDTEVLVQMGKLFYAESGYAALGIPEDEPSIRQFVQQTLDQGFVVLAEVEDTKEVVGMLGILLIPFHLNHNVTVAAENAWWVAPEHRRSKLGPALLQYGKAYAHMRGAQIQSMSVLATSPPGTKEFLEAQGLQTVEYALMGKI